VPGDVLHLLPGDGAAVGAPLVADPRIAGVAFTGSTETAARINRVLAAKDGPIVPLIAETGGQNALIVDSSALPEQVVRDTVVSGFQSAGQRCSALRVLFVQQDIAPKLTEMLAGAMAELKVGDPALLSTDVGPVIDKDAKAMLESHAARMAREASSSTSQAQRRLQPRLLLRTARLSDRFAAAARARSLRPDPARHRLCRRRLDEVIERSTRPATA
jgi:RHH-type proline utilization regulon transcriptional repressor/proline dehydrogenase/delta 1-pyrroline-5-carboxylate dehydrogenase